MDQETIVLKTTQALESSKSAHKRIDALEKEVSDIHELAEAMAAVSVNVDNLKKDVSEMKEEVKKVADRPKVWWDKLVAAALGAVAAGVVGAILSLIFVK